MSLAVCSVSENGKVAVEYNSSQEEPADSLTEEELKGLVQVKPVGLQLLRRACVFHLGTGDAAVNRYSP